MKKLLSLSVAGTAILAAACSTAAMASQDDDIRIIVERDGDTTQSVVIRGIDVELSGGDVIIESETIETDRDGRVIISGDNIEVIDLHPDGNHALVFTDADHTLRLAEIEAHIDEELSRLEDIHVIVEELHIEGLSEAMAELESELSELEGRRMVVVNGERRELTEEERTEIRRELAEAREDMRSAMIEVRREMAESGEERREAQRIMRIELQNARDEIRRAHRHARDARANVVIDREIIERVREAGANRIRIESRDGEDRVWVDGQELDGDERTEWLNRLEVERLAGGRGTRSIEIDLDED